MNPRELQELQAMMQMYQTVAAPQQAEAAQLREMAMRYLGQQQQGQQFDTAQQNEMARFQDQLGLSREQMAQSGSQFDRQLGQSGQQFQQQFQQAGDQFGQQMDFRGRELKQTGSYQQDQLGISREGLGLQRSAQESSNTLAMAQLADAQQARESQLNFLRENARADNARGVLNIGVGSGAFSAPDVMSYAEGVPGLEGVTEAALQREVQRYSAQLAANPPEMRAELMQAIPENIRALLPPEMIPAPTPAPAPGAPRQQTVRQVDPAAPDLQRMDSPYGTFYFDATGNQVDPGVSDIGFFPWLTSKAPTYRGPTDYIPTFMPEGFQPQIETNANRTGVNIGRAYRDQVTAMLPQLTREQLEQEIAAYMQDNQQRRKGTDYMSPIFGR